MTDSERYNNADRYNSIDLNDFYNLNRCLGGDCVRNFVPSEYPVPPIEQLAMDKSTNPERNQAFQTEPNETAFANSSPVLGDLNQMYQPITREQADLYPTPAVVQEEIEQNAKNNKSNQNEPDHDGSASNLFVPYEVTRESLQYLNGFIRTQIGRRVTIDFLIGSDTTVTKTGYLLAVAQNYLLINELDTNDVTACDLYTMKFIRFYY